jgi:hypothetical protein
MAGDILADTRTGKNGRMLSSKCCHSLCSGVLPDARSGAENPHGREHHGEIAERVIARANPDGAHIRVASAKAVEHQRDAAISEQGSDANCAHDFGAHDCPVAAGGLRISADAPQQQAEASQRRAEGATLKDLARSYNVSMATISRLRT